MQKAIQLLKANKIESFCFLAFLFESFILYGNILLFLVFSLLSMILCFLILKRTENSKKEFKSRKSAYHFFYSFLKEMREEKPIKTCYASSSKYLISYQEIIPFEEMTTDHCINLYSFQPFFSLILLKDKQNEAFLLNPTYLLESVEEKISAMEKGETKLKTRFQYSVLILFVSLLFLVILSCFIKTSELFTNLSYIIPTCLFLPLTFPCILEYKNRQYQRISS